MTKIILTLFFLWIGWKVVQSVLEEIQGRMEDRRTEETNKTPTTVFSRSSKRSRPITAMSSSADSGTRRSAQQTSSEEESEMERLLREARERKRQIEGEIDLEEVSSPSGRASTKNVQPRPHEPRPPLTRVPPAPEHRPRPEVAQRRAAQAREYFAATPSTAESEMLPPVRTPHRVRERVRHEVSEKTAGSVHPASLHRLDMNDIREGVIIAEILGTPKGLGDIDSHVV